MTLISHEIPKCLFPVHDLINDYPYVLAHLVNEDEEYTEFYTRKCQNAPYSILDNSAFELGASVSFEKLLEAAETVNPTHIIIPDVVNDCEKTVKLAEAFMEFLKEKLGNNYHNWPYKLIGVLQGENLGELYHCFNKLSWLKNNRGNITTIALPFDTIPGTDYHNIRYTVFQQMKQLFEDNYFDVHLLGLQNYSEYYLYSKKDRELIKSVDSSAPIIYGWNGVKFGYGGTNLNKPKDKLADNLDIDLRSEQVEDITYNILHIRKIFKR